MKDRKKTSVQLEMSRSNLVNKYIDQSNKKYLYELIEEMPNSEERHFFIELIILK